MSMYKTVHVGPKTPAGGAHAGLINCEYQLYASIKSVYHRTARADGITAGVEGEVDRKEVDRKGQNGIQYLYVNYDGFKLTS